MGAGLLHNARKTFCTEKKKEDEEKKTKEKDEEKTLLYSWHLQQSGTRRKTQRRVLHNNALSDVPMWKHRVDRFCE